MKRPFRVALAGLAAAAAVFVIFRFDPATSALFPPCPFHALTGLHCPGCGSLRGFHALLHGDWRGALASNPVTMLALPFLVASGTRQVWRWGRGAEPLGARMPAWTIWSLLALIVGFSVLRNLPAFAWLAPPG